MKAPIRQVLDHKPHQLYAVEPEATVAHAVRVMNDGGVGSVLVMVGERLVGIFTERDILVRVIDGQRDATRTRVGDVMTPAPICVAPTASVADTMLLVTESHCRHLPVIENDLLIGVVSIGDLIRWVVRNQDDRLDTMLRVMRVVTRQA